MPQFDFVLCEDERNLVIEFCFSTGCEIVPDTYYDTGKYITVSNKEEYLKDDNARPLIFLVNSKYTNYPLEMKEIIRNGNKKYYIKPRQGGPAIELYSPVIGERENRIVGPGFISFYPFYYKGEEKIFPNDEFKKTYQAIKAFIAARSVKVALTKRTFFFGKDTAEKCRAGSLNLLPISGLNLLDLL